MTKQDNKDKYGTEFISLRNDIVDLRERIHKIIWGFAKRLDIIKHPKDRELIVKFLPFLKPVQGIDNPGAMPVCSKSERARIKNTTSCIFAYVSWMMQLWGTLPQQKLDGAKELLLTIGSMCNHLGAILELGLSEYVVYGDVAKGYALLSKDEAAEEEYFDYCLGGGEEIPKSLDQSAHPDDN